MDIKINSDLIRLKMGTTLYHWTSRDAMKLILASKKLELEGTEYMAGLRGGLFFS